MPLILLPNTFADDQSPHLLLPEGLSSVLATLDGLIAESERAGRRYLIKMLKNQAARELSIFIINEHSSKKDYEELAVKIQGGLRLGMVSDAGMCGIADPGALLVSLLRKKGCQEISAIPGPSSIVLAIVLSGFGGQSFSFHGYLPREQNERQKELVRLEKMANETKTQQIFIEAPYRNQALFLDCLQVLRKETFLSVACNLSFSDEEVHVHSISSWREKGYEVPKKPCVFILTRAL